MPALLRQHVIDEIVFAVDSDKLADLEEVFLLCDEEGVRTRVAVDFFPHVNSTVYLERLGTTPLLTFSAAPARRNPADAEARDRRRSSPPLGLVVLLPFMAAGGGR